MSKHMKLFFTVSVVLNIILLGVMAGAAFHAYNKYNRHFESKFAGLSPEVKEKLKGSFRDSRDEFYAFIEEGKIARQQLKDAMNGAEFDPELYDEASGKLNDLRYKMMQHKAERTKTIIEDLPADERRQILGYLLRGGMDGFHHGGRSKYGPKKADCDAGTVQQHDMPIHSGGEVRPPQQAGGVDMSVEDDKMNEDAEILTPIPD